MAGLAAGLAATILAGLAGTYQGQQGTLTAWRIEIEPLGKWKEPRTELPRPRAPARLLCTLFTSTMASTGRTVSSPLLQVLALWISVLLFPIVCISGHGFLSTPRSRNLVAYEDRKYYQETETTPFPEDCPSCINRGGVLARCGVLRPGQGDARNYDFPKNAFGDPMPANPQQIYEEGSVIDIEVVLTAHQ